MANKDGEIILGLDINQTKIQIEKDLKKVLRQIKDLEVKVDHAKLSSDAKKELKQAIKDVKDLTVNIDKANFKGQQDLQDKLNKLQNLSIEIQNARLDTSFQTNLQSVLDNLNGLSINISDVNINQNAVQQTGQKIGQQIGQQVQQGIQSIIQKGNFTTNFGFDGNKLNSRNDTAQRAKRYFQRISDGIVSVREEMELFEGKNQLQGFVIDIKNAEGAVESLRYRIHNLTDNDGNITGKVFQYRGGQINDKGVIKQITAIETAIASYKQKVAQFKSTNEGILSGIDFTNFNNALQALENGTGSINAVKNAYKDLGVQASTITKELSGQLSKAGTAVRNISKGTETISGLRAEFKGLSEVPKDAIKQLDDLDIKLKDINDIESKFGRNVDWAKAYREWQDEVDILTARLRVLQKEQTNASSAKILSMSDLSKGGRAYISKVSNTVNKNSPEIQKMANSFGWQDWDITGIERADGMVKKLTVTFTDAEGAIKRFVMQRDKIVSAKGNEYNALVQFGDVQVIKTATSAEKELANAIANRREQSEQSRKSEEKRLDVAQFKAQNKAIENEIKDRNKLADAMTKGREQSELSRKAEEKRLSDAQNKAINKNIEQQAKDSAKKREQAEKTVNTQLNIQKNTLNDIISLEGKIANLDPSKESEQIADLKNQQKIKRDIYNTSRQYMKTVAQEVMETEELVALEKRRRDEMRETAVIARQSVSALNEKASNKELDKQTKKIENIDSKVADNTYATQINDLITKYKQYGFTVDQAEEKVKELRTALATMSKADISADERIKAEQRFQEALRKSNNEVKVYQQNQRGLATDSSRLALANTMESFLQKNTKITSKAKQEIVSFIAQLRNLDSEMTRVARNEMNDSFRRTQNEMRALGKLGYAFSDQMKQAANSFTQWFSVSSLIMSGIYHARNAVTELKEIDTYLTEISKANNELTKSELADIGNHSFDIASNYGKTATDFLSAVQEASRAGYDNAEGIAELSTAAQGAGDMTADVANQMLIATDKAYKMNGAVDLLRNTLDGMNFITNNNAVNMTELSEGMTIVASTAASFGVDVNELTAALGTMSATTQQSGSEVARAFRAILLNIRQVSDEEEGIDAEGLTKYERACNALGVSLKETKNGVLALRDPMDVLRELSVEYNKLEESDLRRTELLNAVGGKLRATQLDALLRQWSMYEKMLGEYEAGMGSMAVEAEKTANSWQGSLNRLSNTFADTIGNIVNSDSMITLINSFNTFLEVINKTTDALGAFGSVGVIGAGIFGAKGQG